MIGSGIQGGAGSVVPTVNDIPTLPKSKIDTAGTWPTSDIPELPQTQITGLIDDLAARALASHTHAKKDITDFAHTHSLKEIIGLEKALASKQNVLPKAKPAVFHPLLINYRVVKQ